LPTCATLFFIRRGVQERMSDSSGFNRTEIVMVFLLFLGFFILASFHLLCLSNELDERNLLSI
jgi:hypothetical protein